MLVYTDKATHASQTDCHANMGCCWPLHYIYMGCAAQAATLGGQLAAHCRREADLGVITPQELLQSAQRQRCYLGYIPQPPQVHILDNH